MNDNYIFSYSIIFFLFDWNRSLLRKVSTRRYKKTEDKISSPKLKAKRNNSVSKTKHKALFILQFLSSFELCDEKCVTHVSVCWLTTILRCLKFSALVTICLVSLWLFTWSFVANDREEVFIMAMLFLQELLKFRKIAHIWFHVILRNILQMVLH